MGSLYRRKYAPAGQTYAEAKAAGTLREAGDWWMKYRHLHGVIHRESTGTANHADAKRLLKLREGRAAEGKPILPRADKVTIDEITADLKGEYRANNRRSIDRLEHSLRHVLSFFGGRRATQVSAADVDKYIAARREAGTANATINRELAALKRAYVIAIRGEKLYHRPYIPRLDEDNARQGFFEADEFSAILPHLPDYIRPAIRFAYITGWRIRSEVLPLTWAQIDFAAGTVRLEVRTTKNKHGRTFVMTSELRALLELQRRLVAEDTPWVFPYRGKRLGRFDKSWRTACLKAGLGTLVSEKPRKIETPRLPHDFRRTAVTRRARSSTATTSSASATCARPPRSSPRSLGTVLGTVVSSQRSERRRVRRKSLISWWAGTGLNRRHQDFQSCALPTELPAHQGCIGYHAPR
jgi:integrase